MANEDVEKEKRELELQRQKRFSGGPGSRFISGGEQANDFKAAGAADVIMNRNKKIPSAVMAMVMLLPDSEL